MFAPLCVCQRLGHVFCRINALHLILPACCASGRCRLLCVFNYCFPHWCCAVNYSQGEFLVVSPPLSTVSPPRTLQQWPVQRMGGNRAGTISFSDRPGVRALIKTYIWSRCTLVNPGQSTSRVYTHVGHISIIKKSQPLLTEGRFSPGFVLVWVL